MTNIARCWLTAIANAHNTNLLPLCLCLILSLLLACTSVWEDTRVRVQ